MQKLFTPLFLNSAESRFQNFCYKVLNRPICFGSLFPACFGSLSLFQHISDHSLSFPQHISDHSFYLSIFRITLSLSLSPLAYSGSLTLSPNKFSTFSISRIVSWWRSSADGLCWSPPGGWWRGWRRGRRGLSRGWNTAGPIWWPCQRGPLPPVTQYSYFNYIF